MLCNTHGFSSIRFVVTLAALALAAAIIIPMFQEQQTAAPVAVQFQTAPKDALPSSSQQEQPTARQQIENWPPIPQTSVPTSTELLLRKNYYVILDGSGSMKEIGCSGGISKFASATAALQDFFATIPADANIGLYIFDSMGQREKVPLGTANRDQLQTALNVSSPDGGTPLNLAIHAGWLALTTQASAQLGYGEYHLVVVTDGEASKGYDPITEINRIIDNSTIVIHTIGYCIGTGHSLNQPGRTLYSSVDNAHSLSRELKAVLAEAESFDVSQFK